MPVCRHLSCKYGLLPGSAGSTDGSQNNNDVIQQEEIAKEKTDKSLWQKIKGKKAREVYSRNYSKNTRFDIGYKFRLLWGYGDDLINVAGMSVFAGAYLGLSWKRAGLDIGLIPAGIITANFRIDIDNLKWFGSY